MFKSLADEYNEARCNQKDLSVFLHEKHKEMYQELMKERELDQLVDKILPLIAVRLDAKQAIDSIVDLKKALQDLFKKGGV